MDKESKNDDNKSDIVDKNVLLEALEENVEVKGETSDMVDGKKKIKDAFEIMMVKNQNWGDFRPNSPRRKHLKRLKNIQKNDEAQKGSMMRWLKRE